MTIALRPLHHLVLVALVALSGCSFSDSSASISESVSSPFTSSSKSSKSGGQSYEDDVRDYTASFVKGGGSADGLKSGLAGVASRHRVSNWEADLDTYEGVGRGLARAGLRDAAYRGFRDALTGGEASRSAAVDRGYTGGK